MTSCFTPRLATALAGTLLGLVATAAQAADPAPGTAPAVTATTTGTNPGVGGTVTTSSGLVFKLMKAGAGPSPTAVSYTHLTLPTSDLV